MNLHASAEMLGGLGGLAAVPTAAAGAADWSDSCGPDQRVGAVHAIANLVGVVHGPASVPQVAYGTRIEGGQIELRVPR